MSYVTKKGDHSPHWSHMSFTCVLCFACHQILQRTPWLDTTVYLWWNTVLIVGSFVAVISALASIMSLACLVCHGMSSPSQSFRSYSVSSSEEENRCGAAVACLSRKILAAGPANRVGTSKVTPVMATGQGIEGAPRLQRSRAVSRDLVRDWNFDEIVIGN